MAKCPHHQADGHDAGRVEQEQDGGIHDPGQQQPELVPQPVGYSEPSRAEESEGNQRAADNSEASGGQVNEWGNIARERNADPYAAERDEYTAYGQTKTAVTAGFSGGGGGGAEADPFLKSHGVADYDHSFSEGYMV